MPFGYIPSVVINIDGLPISSLPITFSAHKSHHLLGVSSQTREVCFSLLLCVDSQPHSAFQQAVLKSVNDKSAHLQKQLDSVLREGEWRS